MTQTEKEEAVREPIKINDGEYLPLNATVLCVSINGAGITIALETRTKLMELLFPISTGIVADLCRIMDVDDLADVGRTERVVHVRALGFASWSEGVKGIAHVIKNFGISQMDYYKWGDPKEGLMEKKETLPPHGEEKIFYMSTLDPPPGLPWVLNPDPHSGSAQLLDANGEALGLVKQPLAEWLTKKAQLATFQEVESAP